MTRPASALAAFVALASSAASAAPPPKPCLSPAEVQAIVAVVAPAVVTRAAARCRTALPANAYLVRSGTALVSRLRPAAMAAVPAARLAFGRVAGVQLPAALDDATVIGLIEVAAGEELVKDIKPAQCGGLSRLLEQVDPLPAKNLSGLVATLAELGALGGEAEDDVPFRICPALTRQ